MKTNSSLSKFLVLALLAASCAPAFAWRPRLFGPRIIGPHPRIPIIVPVPPPPASPVRRAVEVQRALAGRGYYHGAIDGVIGPASRGAIRAFQAERGLAVTGEIDAALLRALRL